MRFRERSSIKATPAAHLSGASHTSSAITKPADRSLSTTQRLVEASASGSRSSTAARSACGLSVSWRNWGIMWWLLVVVCTCVYLELQQMLLLGGCSVFRSGERICRLCG